MRVGIVCPYSFDVPGGVQHHVRDLAEHLIGAGHEVSVLAPAEEGPHAPGYLRAAGRAVAVRYNGSIARVRFGPVSAARVRRWLAAGRFDVLHIHEPMTPSLSVLALWAADVPIVATFHTAFHTVSGRSRAMQAATPLLRPSLGKISTRIAVSEDARRTVVAHLGGDAVVIPNGVYVDRFAGAAPRPAWMGTARRPTIGAVGRFDEPRKGLGVLMAAMPAVLRRFPGARLLVLGRGEAPALEATVAAQGAVVTLGCLDDATKASLLRSVDVYVAPHTGGESFGIVLVEAMSAGAPVVASDLPAFRRVLWGGRLGVLSPPANPAGLADALVALLSDPARRSEFSARASVAVREYDWARVGSRIEAVYASAEGSAYHSAS